MPKGMPIQCLVHLIKHSSCKLLRKKVSQISYYNVENTFIFSHLLYAVLSRIGEYVGKVCG